MDKKKLKYTSEKLATAKIDIVAAELNIIHKRHGLIEPKTVVDEARPEEAPLHPFFEWDKEKNHEAYLLIQAQRLIRMVYVKDVSREDSAPVRAFVNVRVSSETADDEESPPATQGYVPMQEVLKSNSMKQNVLDYAYQQLVLWKKKFGIYKEFFEVVKAIEKTPKPS